MAELFTIGHSNQTAVDFLALLQAAEINLVIDVRSSPRSRWPQFQRDNLIRMIRSNGMEYLWGGRVLGGLNEISPEHPLFAEKMEKIISLVAEGKRVALMCSEGNPCECHRAGKLAAWCKVHHPEIAITHIVKGGELLSNDQVLPGVKENLRWSELSY